MTDTFLENELKGNLSATFKGEQIPDYMHSPVLLYITKGIPTGDFLRAVISNDLKTAVGRADDENIKALAAYVSFFYMNAPSGCWGSPQAYDAWLSSGGLYGSSSDGEAA